MLEKYNSKCPDTKIVAHCFSNGTDLLESMNAGLSFDLFLLDIRLPDIDGIALAKKIRAKNDKAIIVYVTQYTNYAFDAFRVSAAQYLQKPVREICLFPVLDKVVADLTQIKRSHFMLSTRDGLISIPFSNIVCAELSNRRLHVYLENGETLISKSLQISFSKSIAPLLEDQRFLHIHQAFVVNLAHIIEQRNSSFVTKNDLAIPISRNRYPDAKRKYIAYRK